MVTGVERFRDHFAGHEHQYVLIGGAACELIMGEVGLEFRATKDLDIVLIVEALDRDFAATFWAFVEEGAYEIRQRSDSEKVLYRFQKPSAEDFPAMLELFSRTPENLSLADDAALTPLPIDEAAASLSAILLDENYYAFLKSMVRKAEGLPVLDEAAIIPFKAKAWLDLTRQKDEGVHVGSRTVKKHRNDVARLLQLLAADARYDLADAIREDMRSFISELAADENFDPGQFDVGMTRDEVIYRLTVTYAL